MAGTAVVVGAGVGGLAVAGGLARAGWQVTLLEQADRLRAAPTALLLWPSGVRALHALGLGDGLPAITTAVPDGGLRRPDGRWLGRPAAAPGPPPLLAHAEDVHDALVAGLGDRVAVRTQVAARAVPADGAPRPAVTDGRHTWEADLVVGADGVDSTLRRAVAPASQPVSAGATAWRAVIPWYRAPALPTDPAGSPPAVTLSGGYRFRFAPLGERSSTGTSGRGGLYWSATVPGAPRPESPATQLELLRRWFAGWHAPIEQLLAATEPGDVVQRELRSLRPAPGRLTLRVGSGALVLLGDAAHAFVDHLGMGACLAAEDAATLVGVVGTAAGGSLPGAVARYEGMRRARLARVRRRTGRAGAEGLFGRFAGVQVRRRDRAVAVAASWHPAA